MASTDALLHVTLSEIEDSAGEGLNKEACARKRYMELIKNIMKWAEDLEDKCIKANPQTQAMSLSNINHGLDRKLFLYKHPSFKIRTDEMRENPDAHGFFHQCWMHTDDRPMNIRISKYIWDWIHANIINCRYEIDIVAMDPNKHWSTSDKNAYGGDIKIGDMFKLPNFSLLFGYDILVQGNQLSEINYLLQSLLPVGYFAIKYDPDVTVPFFELGQTVMRPAIELQEYFRNCHREYHFQHPDIVAWELFNEREAEGFDFKEVGYLERVEGSKPRAFFGKLFPGLSYKDEKNEWINLVKPYALVIQEESRVDVLKHFNETGKAETTENQDDTK